MTKKPNTIEEQNDAEAEDDEEDPVPPTCSACLYHENECCHVKPPVPGHMLVPCPGTRRICESFIDLEGFLWDNNTCDCEDEETN